MLGLGTDPAQPVALDDFSELGVFREEAVAGVDRVGMGDFGGRDDVGHVEIGIFGSGRADADRFVGQADVHRVAVGGRVNRNRGDAHFVARTMNPQRDFAAVGDQQFLDRHGWI